MNTYDLAIQEVKLKKVSASKGGEFHGPCPGCGGDDRFCVWPNTNGDKGSYWCRSCGKAGDNIQFLIDFKGMDFKSACAFLNISIQHQMERPAAPPKQQFRPTTHQHPVDLWQEKAEKFVSWAQENLQQNKEAMDWLAARGIPAAAAITARLGWNPGEEGRDIFRSRSAWGLPEMKKENGRPRMLWLPIGLVVPYVVDGIVLRIRIRRPEGEPRYYVIPGSSMATMIIGADRKAFVVIESELDGIACAAATEHAGAMALGMLEGKPDAEAYAILKDSIQILNALDYGDEGGGKKAAERAMAWWSENFNDRCDRWPVPKGKDPGEAYQQGIDLKQWIEAGLAPVVIMTSAKGERSAARSADGITPERSERGSGEKESSERDELQIKKDMPPLIAELYKLLRDNPAVKIINKPDRLSIERNGKYVGGRINDLVFKEPDVQEYILNHPDEEINYLNYLKVPTTNA